jgi:arylsulfatase A-like enzyme
MIMTDQHRAEWLSCRNPGYVNTPNIDALAKRGVLFARASCNSPVCAPSRASLASGMLPHRIGALNNKRNYPLDHPTYYQALRRADYRVAIVGKTDLHKADHFYGEQGDLPIMYHFGFTDPHEVEGKGNASRPKLEGGGGDSFKLAGPYQKFLQQQGLLETYVDDMRQRKGKPSWHAQPSKLPASAFHDSYIGAQACRFIDEVPDESPWHLHVSFVGPHHPWDAPAEYADRYSGRSYPVAPEDGLRGKPEWIRVRSLRQSNGMESADLDETKRYYAGAIELIDDWVGRMMESLARRGFADDTVVIFCSDHGEMMGDHGLFHKTLMYEGALRIPLIIADPARPGGYVSEALAELMDLHPTMLELAGVSFLADRIDAKSLVGLLDDVTRGGDSWNGNAQNGRGPDGSTHGSGTQTHKPYQISILDNCKMIFDGRYKLIDNYNDVIELYDLERDPHELRNVAVEQAELTDELVSELKRLCK